MQEITAAELKQKIDNKEDFQLVDVREDFEYEHSNIGGLHIPLAGIMLEADKIETGKPVIFMCRSGKRSMVAMQQLAMSHGLTNLYNLKGGILAWQQEVDPALSVY